MISSIVTSFRVSINFCIVCFTVNEFIIGKALFRSFRGSSASKLLQIFVSSGMQGRKNYSEKLFMNFQLSERIPKDNFYRRLKEALDLKFLYNDTRELYGKTGNPSIDPVVFFKLMLT